MSDLDSGDVNATAEKITSTNTAHGVSTMRQACGNYIYIATGEWKRANFTNVVERYDPNTNTWENVDSELSTKRSLFGYKL